MGLMMTSVIKSGQNIHLNTLGNEVDFKEIRSKLLSGEESISGYKKYKKVKCICPLDLGAK